jgi:hypothetical protein
MLRDDAFMAGLLFGGLLAGGACGMVPLCTALRLGRVVIGVICFLLCIGAGIYGGLCFGIPTACGLSWLVSLLGSRSMIPTRIAFEEPSRRRGGSEPEEPYTQIGPTIVCNECRTASRADAGGRPPVCCPGCQLPFRDEDPPVVRRARRDDDIIDLKPAGRG